MNGDIMTSSLTLPGSGFYYPKRKHSLHDVLDWDRPDPVPQSDAIQRILDVVKRTGIIERTIITIPTINYYLYRS